MRGGARAGAGRLPSLEPRKMRSLRATEREWQIIKAFADILKNRDANAAKNFVCQFQR